MDELTKEIQEKKELIDRKNEALAKARAKSLYKRKASKGDWSTYVPEYEGKTVTDYINLKNIEEIKLEDKRLAKKEIEVSITKGFNRVAVNIRDIDEVDYDYWKGVVIAEVKELWAVLPHSDDTSKKPVVQSKETYQREVKQEERTEYKTPQKERIETKFAKGKQIALLQQGIDKGLFTIEQVNAISSWEESQDFIGKVFASGKKKY